MLKICAVLIKEKDFDSFRHRVPMWTIRTMNTTAGLSLIGILKICTALNKEKGVSFIQISSDDRDDKDDDMIPPISFKISIPKYYHHSRTPLLKPVCRFVRFFQRTRESTLCMAFGA